MMRASRAPGVSSLGMICAVAASISAACSGEKNSSLAGWPDCATLWAWLWAARMPGQLVASQAETEPARKDRREAPGLFMLPLVHQRYHGGLRDSRDAG